MSKTRKKTPLHTPRAAADPRPSKAAYKARRADRPAVVAVREVTAQQRANREAMRGLADTTASSHADAMENALEAVYEAAEEAGVNTWQEHDHFRRDLLTIVAEIDPESPAAPKVADALGELLTQKHALERLEGGHVYL